LNKGVKPTAIGQASLLMVGFLFLSRLLGQLRDTVISVQFGQNALTDAYRAAFSVPDLLFFLIAGGALSSAFIPVFTSYWAKGEEVEAWKVFSTLATLMGLLVLVFIIFAGVYASPLVHLVVPGLPEATHGLTVAMTRILLPTQLAFFLGGLMFGTMNARRHYTIPGMSPNIYNIGILFGALVISQLVPIPIMGLAWGALTGAIIGNLVIPIYAMGKFGSVYRPSLDIFHPGVVRVFKLMLPVVLGLSLPGVYGLVIRWFASQDDAGVITALDIGNRIMQAPLGILGQGLAIAVFPVLSALFAENKAPEFLSTLGRSLRVTLYLAIFISAMLFVLSEDVVRLLNQYGKFTSSDTLLVAGGLQMMSLGVFAWCAHPILMRAFFAMHDSVTPIVLGTLTTAGFIVLCAVLSSGPLGYKGLALATSLSAMLLLVLLLVGLRKRLTRVGGRRLLQLCLVAGGLTIVVAGVSYLAYGLVPGEVGSHMVSLIRILVLGFGGLGLYLWLGSRVGMEEARYALSGLRNRRGSPDGAGNDQ
jgi:putative peptidoglycan lipid II flippase